MSEDVVGEKAAVLPEQRPLGRKIEIFLVGRERPPAALAVFNESLSEPGVSMSAFQIENIETLAKAGVTTVSDLLALSASDLRGMNLRGQFLQEADQTVSNVLEHLRVTPAMRLARQIIIGINLDYKDLTPVEEIKLGERVESLISQLMDPNEVEVLRLKYDYDQWQVQDHHQVAKKLEKTVDRVRRLEKQAIRKLKILSERQGISFREYFQEA